MTDLTILSSITITPVVMAGIVILAVWAIGIVRIVSK